MNEQKKYRTDFLTANFFVIGMGSVYNIAGNYFKYNSSETAEEADCLAIANDWRIVGQDLSDSIHNFEKENEDQLVIPFVD